MPALKLFYGGFLSYQTDRWLFLKRLKLHHVLHVKLCQSTVLLKLVKFFQQSNDITKKLTQPNNDSSLGSRNRVVTLDMALTLGRGHPSFRTWWRSAESKLEQGAHILAPMGIWLAQRLQRIKRLGEITRCSCSASSCKQLMLLAPTLSPDLRQIQKTGSRHICRWWEADTRSDFQEGYK